MDNVNQPAAGGSKTGLWVALVIAVIVIGVGAYFLFARDNGTNTNNANSVGNQTSNVNSNENLNLAANDNSNVNAVVNGNTNAAVNENTNVETNTNAATNTNSTVDTSDWRTYENSEYGFSFRYPANLGSVNEYTVQNVYNGNLVTIAGISAAEANPFIQVDVVNDTLENVKSYLESSEFTPSGESANWQGGMIDGVPFQYDQVDFSSDNTFFQNIHVFERQNYVLVVFTYNSVFEDDKAFETFEL